MHDRLFRKAESKLNSHVHHCKTDFYKMFVEYKKSRLAESIKWIFRGASEAEHNLGITLSVVRQSVRLSHFLFAYNFFTLRDKAFIFGMCVPYD